MMIDAGETARLKKALRTFVSAFVLLTSLAQINLLGSFII